MSIDDDVEYVQPLVSAAQGMGLAATWSITLRRYNGGQDS